MTTIVHLIDEFKLGGAQTHLLTMLRHLRQNYPFEHRVMSLFGSGAVYDSLQELGVGVSILDLRPYLARRRFDLAIREIRSHIAAIQPILVEAHLTWSRLLGLAAARLAGIPHRIGFEHGDIYMTSLKFRSANYSSQFYTHRYIVCSHALGEWVHKTHRIPRRKLNVLHNCVDPNRFHPDVPPASDAEPWHQHSDTIFAMVGTLGTGVNKRVDIGIRALGEARRRGASVGLVIAGDGVQRNYLEQLAAACGVADYTHFLGMRQDVPQVLAACDAFCHAAPFEPFGIVALEAMAMARPVIVPDQGGICEAVDNGETGFVYPTLNIEALADAMCRMHEDKSKREKMGATARKAVEERFSVAKYVEQLYILYGLIN